MLSLFVYNFLNQSCETFRRASWRPRSERIAHLPPAHEMEELPSISALPRKFALINSTHENEEIIEEDTGPPSILSERRGTKKRKKMSTFAVPSSRRKSSSSLSRSWVAFKTENSPQKNGLTQSSRGNKVHVSPMDAREIYKNPAFYLHLKYTLCPRLKWAGR